MPLRLMGVPGHALKRRWWCECESLHTPGHLTVAWRGSELLAWPGKTRLEPETPGTRLLFPPWLSAHHIDSLTSDPFLSTVGTWSTAAPSPAPAAPPGKKRHVPVWCRSESQPREAPQLGRSWACVHLWLNRRQGSLAIQCAPGPIAVPGR